MISAFHPKRTFEEVLTNEVAVHLPTRRFVGEHDRFRRIIRVREVRLELHDLVLTIRRAWKRRGFTDALQRT